MNSIVVFGAGQVGSGRRRQFECDGFTVQVEPHEDDVAQAAFTKRLAQLAGVVPREKLRLLGPAYVRFAPSGEMLLLGKREKGLAHFGYVVASWEKLFRDYAVEPGGCGEDEHGKWWAVVPSRVEP